MNNHINYLETYKMNLTSKALSERTIEVYMSNLTSYFTHYPNLTRENILSYKLQISHLSPSSINQVLSSLRSFNEYLLEEQVIDKQVIIKADYKKKQSKGNPTNITNPQVAKFLNKTRTKNCVYQSRNIALIYLMAHTGIRREEVCNLLVKNIDLENEIITLTGKGNKQRTVIITDVETVQYLNVYLNDRMKHKNVLSPYLFLSERGNQLTKETINDIFNFYCTPKNHITPHSLRHNFASTTLEQDVYTLPELQNQLGHASIATTQIYTHARIDVMKKKSKQLKIG